MGQKDKTIKQHDKLKTGFKEIFELKQKKETS